MSEQQFFKERTESNLLIQILQRYLPFWPLFLITMGAGLTISWLYYRSQTKIYMAAAKVLLKDPQKNGGESKVLDALNIFSEKKIVENEIIVLRSSLILEKVVNIRVCFYFIFVFFPSSIHYRIFYSFSV